MKVSPARRAAFEILKRVEQEAAYSSVVLAAADEDLSSRDRGLCHELVLGVLRNRLWLDRTIENFAAREVEKLDLPVALALRLGVYQLRFLTRIPASAAVNESVNLVRGARLQSASSFVNAVLRRATREPAFDPAAFVTDDVEKLSIETSHPRWLIERWTSQFGFEETAGIARANNLPAALAFRFTAKALRDRRRPPGRIIDELRANGVELVESKIAPGAWRIIQMKSTGRDAGDPHAGMRALQFDGLIYFQDEASQLVAHVVDVRDGDLALDVCAAPGSKSTLMAALAPRATFIAAELYEHRARTIAEFAIQQGATNVRVMIHDATRELPLAASFDCVLVDAPCSGTGTLRQNPEIRCRLNESDIAHLADKQKQILKNAATVLRIGGRLVYSTCSMERDENESVIKDFLERNPNFKRARLNVPANLLNTDGTARPWPHLDDVEGFFVTAFERRS